MQGQHVNTFEKGMNKDFNVLFQPDGTYTNCVNCHLVSKSGNNYVIQDAIGNVRTFYINIPYATYDPVGPSITFADAPMPIGFISFPDKLIVFSTNNTSETGGYLEIGKIEFNPYGEGVRAKANSPTNTYSGYVPLYHHVSLLGTQQRQIEGFAYEETEDVQRVYWTDHLNEPRVLDVGNSIYTTYIASGSLSATVGTQYMVLEGVITYNGTVYGPGLTAGNVFSTTGGIVVYTDNFGGNIPTTAKVIEYYPYQLLSFTPTRLLGNMKFKQYGVGSLLCGSKMYFYRLTEPTSGLQTSWSYGSYPVHVGMANDPVSSPSNSYFDFVGNGTTTTTVDSGRSVEIDITNIDTNFTRIQVACAEFDQVLELPRLITIIEDTLITGTSMTIAHTGSVNKGELTLDDITLFPVSIIACKTMTTNKNYALLGNITEREEFDWTNAVTLSESEHSFVIHEASDTSCTNVIQYTNVSPNTGANPALIYAGAQYYVVFGEVPPSANTVLYNGTNYVTGEVILGVIGASAIAYGGTASVRPCASRNKYTTTAGAARPDAIILPSSTGFWSYKEPVMAHHMRGYWADETYRFAVVPFDLKGNPMYARWIGDYTFSDLAANPLMQQNTGIGYDVWNLNAKILKVSGLTFTEAQINQMSGFSIMRAERDKRILSEGLLMQVGALSTAFKPCPGPTPADNAWTTSRDRYFTYISPDKQCSFPDDTPSISYMEGNTFYSPSNYAASGNYMKNVTGDQTAVESRFFTQSDDVGVTRKVKIRNFFVVDEGTTTANFGTDAYTFVNQTEFDAIAGVENGCNGGGTFNIGTYEAAGGRRAIVELDSAIAATGGASNYGDLATVGREKLLIDVTVDNATPYGGTSDAAKANTFYISTGHFQPINSTVKSEVETAPGSGIYTFNNIEVAGGDCFVCLIDYGHSLTDTAYSPTTNSWGIKFPCQCNCNYDLRRGRTPANNGMGLTSPGVSYSGARLESYNVNQAYSSQGIEFAYPAVPIDYRFNNEFKFRVRFGGEKFIGETVDSFRVYLANDYKDLDGQTGEINNLATKRGVTVVWQNAQISSVPILERQLLAAQSGAPTTIGTGGVVDRFDPISSYFGNQHQHGLTQTEFGWVWFDMRRKAVVALAVGSGVAEISEMEGLKGYFDEVFVDNIGSTAQSRPLNSPTFEETSDRPLVGVGITGVYDPKFKITYLTFKFKQYSAGSGTIYTNKDFTIGYYHVKKLFVGFFNKFLPAISHNHNQIVLSANNPKNPTKYYGTGMASTDFVVGDEIGNGVKAYVCTTAGNVAAYANPPSGAIFTEINTTNELWVLNQPSDLNLATAPDYQYNKWFGLVGDNDFEFVVNPKVNDSFSVMAMEQHGNNVYPTQLDIDAGGITASDTNISPTSNFFRFIYDKICHNLPLSSTRGRITDSYLKVRFYKKNWTTNPTTLTGSVKILQYVKSIFTLKR